jgi:hypothetical protein
VLNNESELDSTAAAIEIFSGWLTPSPVESWTCTVKVESLSAVGTPEIVPVEAKLNPAGGIPDARLQVYGLTPPLAIRVVEYALPTIPLGIVVVEIARGCNAAAIDKFNVSAAMLFAVSFTCTVNEKLPDALGMPEMIPADARFNPDGTVPDTTLQLYGLIPPLAIRAVEYELPAIPLGIVVLEIARGCNATAIDKPNVSAAMLFAVSFTCTVNEKFPAALGVPEMIPADARFSPDGSAPDATLQTYGLTPPVASKAAEYEMPAWPPGSEVVLIAKVAGLTVIEKLA